MSDGLDRDELLALLEQVAIELSRAQVVGDIYVVGGAAISLCGWDETRRTHDIDGVIRAGHGAVVEAVQQVGRRHGLPGSWLNEQAAMFVPLVEDADAQLVFERPYLRVRAASLQVLLAMKVASGRLMDISDAATLLPESGWGTKELVAVVEAQFGTDAVTPKVMNSIGSVVSMANSRSKSREYPDLNDGLS